MSDIQLPKLEATLKLKTDFRDTGVEAGLARIKATGDAAARDLEESIGKVDVGGSLLSQLKALQPEVERTGREFGDRLSAGYLDGLSGLLDAPSYTPDFKTTILDELKALAPEVEDVGKQYSERLNAGYLSSLDNLLSNTEKVADDLGSSAPSFEEPGRRAGEHFSDGFIVDAQRRIRDADNKIISTGTLLNRFAKSGGDSGKAFSEQFTKDAAGRIRSSNGDIVDGVNLLQRAFADAGKDSGDVFAKEVEKASGDGGRNGGRNASKRFGGAFDDGIRAALDRTERRLSSFGRGFTIAGLVAGIAALGQQFIALSAAIAPAVAALAAIPAVAAVALAGISSLAVGLTGFFDAIGKANKAAAGGSGGGGANDSVARQRALEAALRDVTKAQRDVESATRDAAKTQRQVDEANRAIEQSYRDVAEASRDVIDSQRGVASAQREVVDAQRGVDQANRSVQSSIRGVASAEQTLVDASRSVADARKAELDAEEALDDARKQATQTLEDYTLRLAQASETQESAELSIIEARERLAELTKKQQSSRKGAFSIDGQAFDAAGKAIDDITEKAKVSQTQIRRAQLDVVAAELRYQQVIKTNSQLQEEAADAQAKGVEGADAVVDARDRIERAIHSEEQANRDLTRAQQSVVDANQQVADSQYAVEEAIRRVSDAQYGVVEANQRVVDAQQGVNEAVQGVIDAQNDLVDANDAVLDANQRIADAQENLTLAYQRVGDAQKQMTEGAAKVPAAVSAAADAMAKLSPNARAAAQAILALKDEWNQLKNTVQDALFAGIDAQITSLAKVSLPTLTTGMTAVATSINHVATASFEAAKTPLFQGNVATIFQSTAAITEKFAGVTGPLVQAISQLAVAGLPLVERFAQFITNGLGAASAFLNTEEGARKTADAINRAGDVLARLGNIAKNIGSSIVTIFQAGGQESYLANLEKITAEFDKFLKSPEGQKDLKTLFETLTLLSYGLKAALELLLPVVFDLLGYFNGLPDSVKNFIVTALALGVIIGPLISGITALSLGIKGVIDIALLLGAAFGTITLPIAAVVLAVAGLVAGIIYAYTHFESFRNVVNDVMDVVRKAVGEVLDFVNEKFQEVGDFIDEILPDIKEAIEHTINALDSIWRRFGDNLLRVIEIAWNAIKGVIDGSLKIIMGIIQIVLGAINGDWSRVWNGIKDVLDGIWTILKTIVRTGIDTIKNIISVGIDVVRAVFRTGWEFIKEIVGSDAVAKAARGAFNAVKDAIVASVNAALNFLGGVPLQIFKIFDRLSGGALSRYGRDLIQGLIDGATALLSRLGSIFANAVPAYIREPFKKALGISSPSKVFKGYGQNIVEGLAEGIAATASVAVDAAQQLADGVSNVKGDGFNIPITASFDPNVIRGISTSVDSLNSFGGSSGSYGAGNTYQIINETVPFTPQQIFTESTSALKQLERTYG